MLMSKQYTYEHKGYILQQTSFNWNYMIFNTVTDRPEYHGSYSEKLTEEQAKREIENWIKQKEEAAQ